MPWLIALLQRRAATAVATVAVLIASCTAQGPGGPSTPAGAGGNGTSAGTGPGNGPLPTHSPAPEDPARRACEAVVAIRNAAAAAIGLIEAPEGEAERNLAFALEILDEVVPFFLADQPAVGRPLRDLRADARRVRAVLPDEVPEPLARRTIRAGTRVFRETMPDCAGVTSLPHISLGPAPIPVAMAGDLTLYLPTPEPVLIGYHESLLPEAQALTPIGRLVLNDNAGKFSPPPDSEGPDYVILAGRGRAQAATSSIDIALDPGAPIHAPVNGEIVDLVDYLLYCEAPDSRALIVADGHEDVRVVVMHFIPTEGLEEGDRVVAGRTLLGTPRVYPLAHPQIDQYLEGDYPHTHIEVDATPDPPLPTC